MAKKARISNGDLTAIFYERLRQASDCPLGTHVAIIPVGRSGWTALMSAIQRTQRPACAKRVEEIERQLRAIYELARD